MKKINKKGNWRTMKRQLFLGLCMVCLAATANAYLIQGVDLNVDHWVGSGTNECVLAIDWNNTSGPYATEFHIFGFRWGSESKTVKDILVALQASNILTTTYGYGGKFLDNIVYDQTVDSDHHTAGAFSGWWWAGDTTNGGSSWNDNPGGVDEKILTNGGIEGFNNDGYNWGSQSMSIPEPATMLTLGLGAAAIVWSRKK